MNRFAPAALLAVIAAPALAQPRTDAHGDPLPEGAIARFGTVRYRVGLGRWPPVFALSPDGKTLAAKSRLGITLFDVESGRLTAEVSLADQRPDLETYRLCFSPDGKRLVRQAGGCVEVLDARTGGRLAEHDLSERLGAWGLAFLPGTGQFVVAGDDWAATFDVVTGRQVRRVEFEERASLVCPSGRLCIGFDGDEWLLFDLISGKLRARLPRITMVGTGPDGEKWAVTPDGRHICFISTTGRFRIIDVKSWDVVLDQTTESPGNAGPFVDVAVSPDGSVIYVIGSVKEVRRWDMKGRNWLAPLPVVEPGTLLPHPDGRHLLVASSVLRRYELRSMRELPGPDGYSGSVSVVPSPDGRRVAVSPTWSGRDPRLDLFDIGGRRLWSLSVADECRSPRWSPDGRWLIHAERDWEHRQFSLREVATGRRVRTFASPEDVRPLGDTAYFTPDARQLIVPMGSGEAVATFDVRTGRCGAVVDPDGWRATDVSPDGRMVLFVASNGVRLYDRVVDRYLIDWTGEMTEYGRLATDRAAFSPEGSYLLTWEVETRDSCQRESGFIVTVRDPVSGRHRASFDVGQDWVAGFALSPDGQWLAYGTDLGELHLWDVVSGQRLGKWSGHRCVIWSVGFAGMSRAVTGSDDMTALVWDLRPKEKPTKPLWDALVGEDAVEAYRAIWAIAADPKGVVLLRDKIGSAKPVSADQMNRWVADLGADNFAAREMATKELQVRGRLLELPLQSARKTTQSEEVRTRLDALLARIQRVRSGEEIVHARAVLAMELAATDAAKKLLAEWAAGAPGARLTIDAKSALGRLNGKP